MVCRAVVSKILFCKVALSRLDCLVGLDAEAANHCRLGVCGDVDAEDSDSTKILVKIAAQASDGVDVY